MLRGGPPNASNIPKPIFVGLIHKHFCWIIKCIVPNFTYKPIKTRGENRYNFYFQELIAPSAEMLMSLHLSIEGGRRKNIPQIKTLNQSAT